MNTISTESYRRKYRLASLDQELRNAMVAEKICTVDRTDVKTIDNPYGNKPTATVQAIAGTYSVSAYTLTDDTLTVADEVIYSEHIFDFEQTLTQFDVFSSRQDEANHAVAYALDKWEVNNLCEDVTGTYTTPTGGFTTASNVNVIISNLLSKVAGFADMYRGLYLLIENTDLPGIIQAAATNGFSFADAALNNGFVTSYMGVDIHVVRSGTFVDATTTTVSGTKTWTNSGHRVFGVKGMTTFASPRGLKYEEKPVSGKTGKEIVVFGYVGFKAWATKASLTIDITLA